MPLKGAVEGFAFRRGHLLIEDRVSIVRSNAPEAQSLLAPRFTGVPKKRSLFLGVEEWGKWIL
jgi:hypothetical protein